MYQPESRRPSLVVKATSSWAAPRLGGRHDRPHRRASSRSRARSGTRAPRGRRRLPTASSARRGYRQSLLSSSRRDRQSVAAPMPTSTSPASDAEQAGEVVARRADLQAVVAGLGDRRTRARGSRTRARVRRGRRRGGADRTRLRRRAERAARVRRRDGLRRTCPAAAGGSCRRPRGGRRRRSRRRATTTSLRALAAIRAMRPVVRSWT